MVLMIIITVILKQEYILNKNVNSGLTMSFKCFKRIVLGWIGFNTSMDSGPVVVFAILRMFSMYTVIQIFVTCVNKLY